MKPWPFCQLKTDIATEEEVGTSLSEYTEICTNLGKVSARKLWKWYTVTADFLGLGLSFDYEIPIFWIFGLK